MTDGARTKGGQFAPGVSGNPGGRSVKYDPEVRAALKDRLLPKALKRLEELLDGNDPDGLRFAIKTCFEWGYPKPPPEVGESNAEKLQALLDALRG